MPHDKIKRGPFAMALGRPRPLTARETRAKKRKQQFAKQAAAEAEFDRRRRGMIAGKKKPVVKSLTPQEIRSKEAAALRAQATRGTPMEELHRALSPKRKKK